MGAGGGDGCHVRRQISNTNAVQRQISKIHPYAQAFAAAVAAAAVICTTFLYPSLLLRLSACNPYELYYPPPPLAAPAAFIGLCGVLVCVLVPTLAMPSLSKSSFRRFTCIHMLILLLLLLLLSV